MKPVTELCDPKVDLNDDHCALSLYHSLNIDQCFLEPWAWYWQHQVKEMALCSRSTEPGGHDSSGTLSGLALNVDTSHCFPRAQSHLSSTQKSTVMPVPCVIPQGHPMTEQATLVKEIHKSASFSITHCPVQFNYCPVQFNY